MVTKTLQGVLTERLGNGLQNRVERFDSARHLESFIKHLSGVCKQKTLQGVLTERLGNGLQNRVERFDSARHLAKRKSFKRVSFFVFYILFIKLLPFQGALLIAIIPRAMPWARSFWAFSPY